GAGWRPRAACRGRHPPGDAAGRRDRRCGPGAPATGALAVRRAGSGHLPHWPGGVARAVGRAVLCGPDAAGAGVPRRGSRSAPDAPVGARNVLAAAGRRPAGGFLLPAVLNHRGQPLQTQPESEFEQAARAETDGRVGMWAELWQFLAHTRKWWLLPILL